MTTPEVTQPDPDGGVEMTDGEFAAFRGVEVTEAMKAEDVDAALVARVEAALALAQERWLAEWDGQRTDVFSMMARHALIAVLPDIWTEASDFLARSDENGFGASHVGAARLRMRARDARLAATTEEPTT